MAPRLSLPQRPNISSLMPISTSLGPSLYVEVQVLKSRFLVVLFHRTHASGTLPVAPTSQLLSVLSGRYSRKLEDLYSPGSCDTSSYDLLLRFLDDSYGLFTCMIQSIVSHELQLRRNDIIRHWPRECIKQIDDTFLVRFRHHFRFAPFEIRNSMNRPLIVELCKRTDCISWPSRGIQSDCISLPDNRKRIGCVFQTLTIYQVRHVSSHGSRRNRERMVVDEMSKVLQRTMGSTPLSSRVGPSSSELCTDSLATMKETSDRNCSMKHVARQSSSVIRKCYRSHRQLPLPQRLRKPTSVLDSVGSRGLSYTEENQHEISSHAINGEVPLQCMDTKTTSSSCIFSEKFQLTVRSRRSLVCSIQDILTKSCRGEQHSEKQVCIPETDKQTGISTQRRRTEYKRVWEMVHDVTRSKTDLRHGSECVAIPRQRLSVCDHLPSTRKISVPVKRTLSGVKQNFYCDITASRTTRFKSSRHLRSSPCTDLGGGWYMSWRRVVWAWLFVVTSVWAWTSADPANTHHYHTTGCEAYASSPLTRNCESLHVRNNPSDLHELCPCTRVVGHLHISLMKTDPNASQLLQSFSFPHLREITEYLFLYHVKGLTSLRTMFPNLSVIRATSLFHNYALVIYRLPDLEEVGLVSLTTILRGSVRIERNPSLCYANTIDWDHITRYRLGENVIKRNREEVECASCPGNLQCRGSHQCDEDRCWGPQHCQLFCPEDCTSGCVGGQCCHQQCVGSCSSSNNASSCVACRHVLHAGTCIRSCPANYYEMYQRCVSWEECVSWGYLVLAESRECVRRCPAQLKKKGHRCIPCPECGRCGTATIRNVRDAQLLRHCTSIENLNISINGGENVEMELEQYLRNIEVVYGYLKIFKTNITSTKILMNLRRIQGETLAYNRYSLVVLDNPSLHTLSSWVLPPHNFTIENGKVFFQSNPRLCLNEIHMLIPAATLTEESEADVSRSNGQEALCEKTPLSVQVRPSPVYGTLTVTLDADHLPSVTAYITYRKAPTNLTLQQAPCSADQGWSVVEVRPEEPRQGRLQVEVGGLVPATRYALYVKIHTRHTPTHPARSDIVYATTSPFNPSEPVGVRWASRSSSTLEVWWEPPRRPHGLVDHYLVTALMLPPASPTLPPHLDPCSEQVKESLRKISEEVQLRQRSALEAKKKWEEEEADEEGGAEEKCGLASAPACCSCLTHRPYQDADPKPQQPDKYFEEYLLQDVNIKDVVRASRLSQQQLLVKTDASAGTTQAAPLTVIPLGIDAEESRWSSHRASLLQVSLTGGYGPQLVPVGLDYTTSSAGSSEVNGSGSQQQQQQQVLVGQYQPHDPRLLHLTPRHTNDSLMMVEGATHKTHLTLRHLRHYTLYTVGVVACLPPTNCTSLLPPTHDDGSPTPPPAAAAIQPYVQCKLCSRVPATTVATTAASITSDLVPEGSLQASTHNTSSSSITLSWLPPPQPNGAVLSYRLQYTTQRGQRTMCLSQQEFEAGGQQVVLSDLAPGNYTCRVRVRSQAQYGPYSAPVVFTIPDSRSPKEGGAVWPVVVVAAVVVATAVVCSWRRYRARYTIPDTLDHVDVNPFYREGFGPSEMFRDEFILWRDDLKVLREHPLGHGSFGMVFTGELNVSGTSRRVAVKTHSETASTDEIKQFLKEAAVMQDIVCHHVVRLLGVVGDYAPVYVVLELMQEGDLKTFLRKHKEAISDQKVLEMAVEAADGMTYLAWRRLVHRDLAARNCMLDHNLTLKIGDFGLSRNVKLSQHRTSECVPAVVVPAEGHGVLPIKWMAPESLQLSMYSSQSDVWSYGVLLWEMATRGATPYKNNTNEEVVRLVVELRATLGRPRHCPTPLGKVMRRAWSYDPSHRPTFKAITSFLLKYVKHEFEERFEQVSFFHSLRGDDTRCEAEKEAGSQYLTSGSDDDQHQHHHLANTSDLSHDSTPEGEATDSCDLPSQKECLLPYHDETPSQIISSAIRHTHAIPSFDKKNREMTEDSESYFLGPISNWLAKRHTTGIPHVYTNCVSVDLPHTLAPPSRTSRPPHHPGKLTMADEGDVPSYPEASKAVASPASSNSASLCPPFAVVISGEPLLSRCRGAFTVSSVQLTTPAAFSGAGIPYGGESLTLPQRHTAAVPFKPASAPNTPSGAPVQASLTFRSSCERHEQSAGLLGCSHDHFIMTGIPSDPDTRTLARTKGSVSLAAIAPLAWKALPESRVSSKPLAPFSNALPPATTTTTPLPNSLSTAASAATRAPPFSSLPSKMSVFSATSDLSSGRRHRHAPIGTTEGVELM
ncbi:insulin receptor-related protein-like [Panulirus ornatus]|uniref:insulin receptor-related protein-like n=1 Tax=Panulirus ornatus TaxID=150431 RepID=UPI003A881D57